MKLPIRWVFPQASCRIPLKSQHRHQFCLDPPDLSRDIPTMKRGKDLLAAIDRSSMLRERATLQQWLLENHDAFLARMTTRVPDWQELVRLFAEAGLTDSHGRPPKPETARKTWQKVRALVKQERKQPRRVETPPTQPAPTVRSAPKPAADNMDEIRAMLASGSRKLPDPIR
jgi:hypothetical protein